MVAFIDAHRGVHGVESICALLPIAPSTYFRRKAEQRDPKKRSARAQRDDVLQAIIRRIWNENQQVYGPRKVWKQMGREQLHAARVDVLDAAYQRHPERFVRKPPAPPELPTAAWINKPKEVTAAH